MHEIKIGQVLKRLLKERHKTLKKVSKDTGIPYSTLHTWQENRQPKDILKAQRLADYFSITLNQLLFDQKDPHEEKPRDPSPDRGFDFFKGTFEIIVKRID